MATLAMGAAMMETRVDLGRGPLTLDLSVERYGVEQLCTPDGDELGWHGGWPAYVRRADADESLRLYEAATTSWKFRVRVYPPEPPAFYWRMVHG